MKNEKISMTSMNGSHAIVYFGDKREKKSSKKLRLLIYKYYDNTDEIKKITLDKVVLYL